MVITKLRQAEGRLGRGSTLCLCGDIVEHLRDTSQLMDAMVESGTKFAMKSSSIAVQMYFSSGIPLIEAKTSWFMLKKQNHFGGP
jgi:hypothetical protein